MIAGLSGPTGQAVKEAAVGARYLVITPGSTLPP